MELKQNQVLRDSSLDRVLYGCWLGIPDSNVAEMAASAGFDWLLIDHEHAPFELADVMAHLRALAPYPVAPVVRPVNNDPALLKKFLEMGVHTFVIPMIDTADQAAACVRALNYPPKGDRGVGSSLARAAHWGQVDGYLENANDEICLIVQAETVTAIRNLDAILEVDGVDGVFLGPSDLAASMGHIGQNTHPDVVESVANSLGRIREKGRIAGVLATDADMIARYRSAGANFVGVSADTLLVGKAFRDCAGQFKD
ncbi:2,4-dihydroxyhept-2-ene-1,7-dioic acid aldolase [Luminiphilus syltensis NOR5-1B]|uniref:2,4-dihydroxyhept-2-ene-1,7-dioic acid aldolase n=1 Tax=Luminiphilus syltensis NOR5-1B TaxID=565045 RepID=B8KTQ6_9GAMM|nr:aldolase/citrate lyase family protein [Luminiphilus syltensis]EED35788.1 2,4-dihydroxyhept-2-ene-1,7-dioic acid aldolase [Luminiphilus syltensis NOR5-1B]